MGCTSFFSLYWMAILLAILISIDSASSIEPLNMKTTPNTTKPGCHRQCGNLTVPYPFGIGLDSGCSLSLSHTIVCDTSYHPPRAFTPFITAGLVLQEMIEVLDIADTQIRLRNQVINSVCYNLTDDANDDISFNTWVGLTTRQGAPYSLSSTDNRLTMVGCDDETIIKISNANDDLNQDDHRPGSSVSCTSICPTRENVVAGPCNRSNGCCQANIPKGSSSISIENNQARSYYGEPNFARINMRRSWSPCAYAFIGEDEGSFKFLGVVDLQNDSTVVDRVRENVPIVFDWLVSNQTCSQAQRDQTTYACAGDNVDCVEGDAQAIGGYRCSCKIGFQGNPYLSHGCSDIDECADKHNNQCSRSCINTEGGYKCSCPSGHSGDGRKDGSGCFPKVPVALGTLFGFILLAIGITWTSLKIKEKVLQKKRDRFFQQNGGYLLKQLLSTNGDNVESAKIFTTKELKAATNNFCEENIVGKGGYGTVYKGTLPGNQVVAVKKSKLIDESQIEQFINELVILTRIDHPNVVKLLGCCLEDEVPLLVYEFIPNGTLCDHIHTQDRPSWLSWRNCLRIATESATALAYVHSIPIIHRDIKSTNILLDDNYQTKICDFGISRLIPIGKTRFSTLVHGTLGYLDPEYFFSSQLTNKSDVYGFGVVLAELLTRDEPILSEDRDLEERNLSAYFLKCKEQGRLNEIVDAELVKEASQDEIFILGELIQSCLSMKGNDRPTMTQVAVMLEELCKLSEN